MLRRFLGFSFLGSIYEAHLEAHLEAHRRPKTEALKTEPLKTNLYKIYDRFTSPLLSGWMATSLS